MSHPVSPDSSWRSLWHKIKPDVGIFALLAFVFLSLSWRLFAIHSTNQLFLYGDSLQSFNALSYFGHAFHWRDPFASFIGQNGQLGNYAMSDPQTSFFYPPFTLIVALIKIFHLQASGIYYSLLLLRCAHLIVGAFFVYLILNRIFGQRRLFSFLGGLIFLGASWNIVWLDSCIQSNMAAWVPILLYTFILYLRRPTRIGFIIYTLLFGGFLYAGGLVNYFFYIWLNTLLLFGLACYFDFKEIHSLRDRRQLIERGLLLFVAVPLIGLALYGVQLAATYLVSGDVTHSPATYDYLSYFGLHFADLIGLVIPQFGLLNFGMTTDPALKYSGGALQMYFGLLPLILLLIGVIYIRSKKILLLAGLLLLNLVLGFGGALYLYHFAYFFPGNDLFRGHYKYLTFVGVYLAIVVPLVLQSLSEQFLSESSRERVAKIFNTVLIGVGFLSFIAIALAFAFSVLAQSGIAHIADYSSIAQTLSSYLLRTVLIGGVAAWIIMRLLSGEKISKAFYLLVILFTLVDTSVNYINAQWYQMPVQNLTSTSMFSCCTGKTVYNQIGSYSQIYLIPEVIGVNPLMTYSAIPNKYLVLYNDSVSMSGQPSVELLKAAGVDGILADGSLNLPGTERTWSQVIGTGYQDLFLYNANGSRLNEWGPSAAEANQTLSFYAVDGVRSVDFYTAIHSVADDASALSAIRSSSFSSDEPVMLNTSLAQGVKKEVLTPTVVKNTATSKTYQITTNAPGALVTNIPYASIWQATVNGQPASLERANYAFLSVPLAKAGSYEITISVDQRPLWAGLIVSGLTLVGLLGCLFFALRNKRHA